jgi:hypothetical protein
VETPNYHNILSFSCSLVILHQNFKTSVNLETQRLMYHEFLERRKTESQKHAILEYNEEFNSHGSYNLKVIKKTYYLKW